MLISVSWVPLQDLYKKAQALKGRSGSRAKVAVMSGLIMQLALAKELWLMNTYSESQEQQ